MRALPLALEIILEVQRKKSNEKITRKKKKLSNLQNVSFPLWISLSFKPHNFFIHFK
jgi:hypothetical protein